VHLCIHVPFFRTGLRELADVYNVALLGTLDWDHVADLARRWRAEDPAYRVLSLAHALMPLGFPESFGVALNSWKKSCSRMTLTDTAKRLENPSSILESRSTQAARIEKAYAIFTLSENYSERLKALAGMYYFWLWPKEEELRKIVPGARSPSMARLRAPARIWNAMARDHGQLPLAAMTLFNLGVITRESLRRPFAGAGRSLKDHPASRLLEVLE